MKNIGIMVVWLVCSVFDGTSALFWLPSLFSYQEWNNYGQSNKQGWINSCTSTTTRDLYYLCNTSNHSFFPMMCINKGNIIFFNNTIYNCVYVDLCYFTNSTLSDHLIFRSSYLLNNSTPILAFLYFLLHLDDYFIATVKNNTEMHLNDH